MVYGLKGFRYFLRILRAIYLHFMSNSVRWLGLPQGNRGSKCQFSCNTEDVAKFIAFENLLHPMTFITFIGFNNIKCRSFSHFSDLIKQSTSHSCITTKMRGGGAVLRTKREQGEMFPRFEPACASDSRLKMQHGLKCLVTCNSGSFKSRRKLWTSFQWFVFADTFSKLNEGIHQSSPIFKRERIGKYQKVLASRWKQRGFR